MFISGSIGITILKKNNKIIILLADDHSNSLYCDNTGLENHLDIKTYLENELNEGNQILLEEVPRDGFELEELWPDSPHTQNLKDFFLNDKQKKITGIDIRPYLIPFSWDILDIDRQLEKYLMKDYIKKLNEFFNLKGRFYDKIFYPTVKNIIINNSGLGKNLLFLKERFLKIKSNVSSSNKTIGEYFDTKREVLEDISNLCDEIMEFNTLLNVFTSHRKSIIHAGLSHSYNMLNWLIKSYNFKVVYKNGINTFQPKIISTKRYNSCIYLPGINKFGISFKE